LVFDKNSEEVLVVFQRNTNPITKDDWRIASPYNLQPALEEYHDNFEHTGQPYLTCNTCPNKLTWLTEIIPRILSGTDPVFELVTDSNTDVS